VLTVPNHHAVGSVAVRPVLLTLPVQLTIAPNEAVTFAIAYQDEYVVVVEKRSGLVTQPGKGHEGDSLLNGLFAHHGSALQRLGKARDYGLVHRLDRETSGLLVIALTAEAYDGLRDQFANRLVKKFYWALTSKVPSGGAEASAKRARRAPSATGADGIEHAVDPDTEQIVGIINKPIAEVESKQQGGKKLARIAPPPIGRPSVTAYRVLQVARGGSIAALVECRPLTGRLHQVRLHMQAIHCPILGDGLYSPASIAGAAPRLALHSHRLGFTHPVTGKTIDVRSDYPKDLRPLLRRLGMDLPAMG